MNKEFKYGKILISEGEIENVNRVFDSLKVIYPIIRNLDDEFSYSIIVTGVRNGEPVKISTKYVPRELLTNNLTYIINTLEENYESIVITNWELFKYDMPIGDILEDLTFGNTTADKLLLSFSNLNKAVKNKLFKTNNLYTPKTIKHCILDCFCKYLNLKKENIMRQKWYKAIKTYNINTLGKELAKKYKLNMNVLDALRNREHKIILDNNYKFINLVIYSEHCMLLTKPDFNSDYYKSNKISSKISKKFKNFKICFYDLETINKNNLVVPYAAGCTAFLTKRENYYSFYGTNSLKEFIKLLDNCVEHTIYYAHNGGKFDNKILINKLISSRNVIVIDYLEKNGRIMTFSFINRKRKVIVLRDSYSLIQSSLKKLCEDFDVKTKKIDTSTLNFEHEDINEHNLLKYKSSVLIYLKADVLGLRQAVHKFNNHIKELFDGELTIRNCMTSASISRNLFKHSISKGRITDNIYNISKELDDIIRPHYFGGRNECFYHGRFNQKSYYYDINSEFPAYMEKQKFPVGEFQKVMFNTELNKKYGISNRELILNKINEGSCFLNCEIKHKISYEKLVENNIIPLFGLSVNIDENSETSANNNNINFKTKKLVFPYIKNYVNKVITARQYKACKKYNLGYDIIINYALITDKCEYIFKDDVNKLYKLKNDNKYKNKSLSASSKIIINSLYGIWGIKPITDKIEIYNKKSEGLNKLRKVIKSGNYIDHYEIGDKLIIKYSSMLQTQCMNIAYAHMITADSRLMLYKLFRRIQKHQGKILYCDTDSVITDICLENIPYFKNKYGLDNNITNLGGLKNESGKEGGYYKEAVILGCKFYGLLGDKNIKTILKAKGIPLSKKYKNKTIKENNIIYNELSSYGNKSVDYNDYLKISEGYDLSINLLSFRGNLQNNLYKHIETKTFNNNYYKGIILNNTILPLKI